MATNHIKHAADLWKAHSQIAELQIAITMYRNLLTDCCFKLYSKECEFTVQAQEFETIMHRESRNMQRSTFRALAAIQFHVDNASNEGVIRASTMMIGNNDLITSIDIEILSTRQ